jgi:hypothetical protein
MQLTMVDPVILPAGQLVSLIPTILALVEVATPILDHRMNRVVVVVRE